MTAVNSLLGIEDIEGIITTGRRTYAKSGAALNALIHKLEEVGYTVKPSERTARKYHVVLKHLSRCNNCSAVIQTDEGGKLVPNCNECGSPVQGNNTRIWIWNKTEHVYSHTVPVLTMFSIQEMWGVEPITQSPEAYETILLAVNIEPDKGRYARDRGNIFTNITRDNIAEFLRHFTEYDADEFLAQWPRFRKTIDFLDDFAKFCWPDATPIDKPNIGNKLGLQAKLFAGENFSNEEVNAAINAHKAQKDSDDN